MKSPVTSWHGAAAIVGTIVIGVGMHTLGMSDNMCLAAMSLVSTTLVGMGLMHASDQGTVNAVVADLDKTVDAVKKDVAIVAKTVAADTPLPPLIAPAPAPKPPP